MIVAIILARGGSKRIPGKNIKFFAGRPVIHYPIESAISSGLFDRIIVSTESAKIAEVARKVGAEAPFRRPDELSDDLTTTAEALGHAIEWLNDHGPEVRYACGIYGAAPFVQSGDLSAGFELLKRRGAMTVLPVTTFDFPIQRAFELDKRGTMRMIHPEYELTRSNDLPVTYHDAGQFYWLDAPKFLQDGKLYGEPTIPLMLPRYRVQDLDTLEDWEMAERLYKAL